MLIDPALIFGMMRHSRESWHVKETNESSGDLQDAFGMLIVGIDARFHLIDHRFIDHQLPVVADGDLEAIHRPRRRSFEVETADVVARAMTRTLELLLCLQPSRGASEMGALSEDRIEALLGAYDPGAEILLELFADLADDIVIRQACFEFRRREKQNARKRASHCGEQSDSGEGGEAAPS